MKKLLLLVLIALTFSCGKSKEEQMLFDYQTKGLKETFNILPQDIDFKIIKIEKIADIKAKDSLVIVQAYFDEKKNNKIELMTEQLEYYRNQLLENEENLKNEKFESLRELYSNYIEDSKKEIEHYQSVIDLYNGDCKETFLEPYLKKINEYKESPEKIVSVKYQASYSQQNPLLKVKQTFEKNYYTNSTDTEFIIEENVQ